MSFIVWSVIFGLLVGTLGAKYQVPLVLTLALGLVVQAIAFVLLFSRGSSDE